MDSVGETSHQRGGSQPGSSPGNGRHADPLPQKTAPARPRGKACIALSLFLTL